jgi:hypothetical protein
MPATSTLIKESAKAAFDSATTATLTYRVVGTPSANDATSDAGAPSTVTVDGQTCYLQSITADSVADGPGIYDVRADYSTESWTVTSNYVAMDMESTAQIVDVWRAGPSFPGSVDTPGNDDIGGTPIDQNGYPISAVYPQQTLNITNIRSNNNSAAIIAALGTRNSLQYLGAAAGTLLFAGASAKRIGDDKYEVTYKIVYDAAYHMRQQPVRDGDGKPRTTTPDANGICNALRVMWRQPFRATSNFANIGIQT